MVFFISKNQTFRTRRTRRKIPLPRNPDPWNQVEETENAERSENDNRSRGRICMGPDRGGGARVWTDLHSRRRQAGGFGGKWVYRRLSARIAANDVTGLTDSLRGGLHIEHAGNRGGSLYTTGIRSSERTGARRGNTDTD